MSEPGGSRHLTDTFVAPVGGIAIGVGPRSGLMTTDLGPESALSADSSVMGGTQVSINPILSGCLRLHTAEAKLLAVTEAYIEVCP